MFAALARAVAPFVFALAPAGGRAEVSLDQIRSQNAASQAAITSLRARVEVKRQLNAAVLPPELARANNEDPNYVIDYARSGRKERLRQLAGSFGQVGDQVRDWAVGTGSSLLEGPPGGQFVPTANISNVHERPSPIEPWKLALFELPERGQSLAELMTSPGVKCRVVGGDSDRGMVRLEVEDPEDRHYQVWVDPSVNFLARKAISTYKRANAKVRDEVEVTSFREVKPGVYFPDRMTHSMTINGKWVAKADCTLTEIQVNEALPGGHFTLKFPTGTRVTDSIRSKSYWVGRDGTAKPEKVMDVSPPPTAPEGQPLRSTPPTADDVRWPWHRVLLIACGAAVLIGLPILIWRRLRNASD